MAETIKMLNIRGEGIGGQCQFIWRLQSSDFITGGKNADFKFQPLYILFSKQLNWAGMCL